MTTAQNLRRSILLLLEYIYLWIIKTSQLLLWMLVFNYLSFFIHLCTFSYDTFPWEHSITLRKIKWFIQWLETDLLNEGPKLFASEFPSIFLFYFRHSPTGNFILFSSIFKHSYHEIQWYDRTLAEVNIAVYWQIPCSGGISKARQTRSMFTIKVIWGFFSNFISYHRCLP